MLERSQLGKRKNQQDNKTEAHALPVHERQFGLGNVASSDRLTGIAKCGHRPATGWLKLGTILDERTRECYRLLEIEPEASAEAARQAYHELLKVWHPDRFPNDPGIQRRANWKTAQINEAYQTVNAYLSGASAVLHAGPPSEADGEPVTRARQATERRTRDDATRQGRAAAEARNKEEREQARRAEEARRAEDQTRERYKPEYLAWIRPGTFVLGSPLSERDRFDDEGPQTRVTISRGFWMSRFQTTQAEYLSVMGNNPSFFKGDMKRPVEQVSWVDANDYCAKMTARERAVGRLPAGYEYRLPTEAEWEFACRAGTSTRFGYGDDPDYAQLEDYAWYDSNSAGATHPVGGKKPNDWGLYDMHGNVLEWCLDWFGKYPGGSVIGPRGPSTGSACVLRGGQWYGFGRDCRSASRNSDWPRGFNRNLGFRVVLAPCQ